MSGVTCGGARLRAIHAHGGARLRPQTSMTGVCQMVLGQTPRPSLTSLHGRPVLPFASHRTTHTDADQKVRIIVDKSCPLCRTECSILSRKDLRYNGKPTIEFVDASSPDFDSDKYGIRRDDAMARLHAILPDGTKVRDMDVQRLMHSQVGSKWVQWTQKEPFKSISDRAYAWWANNRFWVVGESGKKTPEIRSALARMATEREREHKDKHQTPS